jgi:hypothetical protein
MTKTTKMGFVDSKSVSPANLSAENGVLATLMTDEELKELTGLAYKQPQIEWLKRHNIKFTVASNGRAKVFRINAINAGAA